MLVIQAAQKYTKPNLEFRYAGFGISPRRIWKYAKPGVKILQPGLEITNFLSCYYTKSIISYTIWSPALCSSTDLKEILLKHDKKLKNSFFLQFRLGAMRGLLLRGLLSCPPLPMERLVYTLIHGFIFNFFWLDLHVVF